MRPETKKHLKAVLDYVERWNKKDEDREAATAMYELETWLSASNLGSMTSKRKARTSILNGKKGGRPKVKPPSLL